jgi:hypothetical protein
MERRWWIECLEVIETMVARDEIAQHYIFPVALSLTGIQLDPKRSSLGSAFPQ